MYIVSKCHRSGFVQYCLGGDPHYMIRVRGVDHPICVDLPTTDNKIYNVINDPVNREYFFRFSKSQVFISL